MSARRARPRRRLRSELLPLASVACLTLSLVALFPRGTLTYGRTSAARAPADARSAGCAFVTLTPEQETAALAAARTSWQGERTATGPALEMLPSELPQIPHASVLELADRPSERIGFSTEPQVRLLPPTVAATAPARIPAAAPEARTLAFPRGMLLGLH